MLNSFHLAGLRSGEHLLHAALMLTVCRWICWACFHLQKACKTLQWQEMINEQYIIRKSVCVDVNTFMFYICICMYRSIYVRGHIQLFFFADIQHLCQKNMSEATLLTPPKFMYVLLTYHFPAKNIFKFFQLGVVAHADNPTTWGQEDCHRFEASLCYAVSTLSLNSIFRWWQNEWGGLKSVESLCNNRNYKSQQSMIPLSLNPNMT